MLLKVSVYSESRFSTTMIFIATFCLSCIMIEDLSSVIYYYLCDSTYDDLLTYNTRSTRICYITYVLHNLVVEVDMLLEKDITRNNLTS